MKCHTSRVNYNNAKFRVTAGFVNGRTCNAPESQSGTRNQTSFYREKCSHFCFKGRKMWMARCCVLSFNFTGFFLSYFNNFPFSKKHSYVIYVKFWDYSCTAETLRTHSRHLYDNKSRNGWWLVTFLPWQNAFAVTSSVVWSYTFSCKMDQEKKMSAPKRQKSRKWSTL